MTEIKFERYRRDCPANITREERGETLIYDFAVIIDGEKRAVWSRNYRGSGYDLYDIDHQRIRADPKNRYSGVDAKKQTDFELVIQENIEIIPTYADIRARRAAIFAARMKERDTQVKAAKADAMRNHALEMFDFLTRSSGEKARALVEKVSTACNAAAIQSAANYERDNPAPKYDPLPE